MTNNEHLLRELAEELRLLARKLERIPFAARGDIPERIENAVLAISNANAAIYNAIEGAVKLGIRPDGRYHPPAVQSCFVKPCRCGEAYERRPHGAPLCDYCEFGAQ